MEEFAGVHGAPFASSEEVIRQRNGRHESSSGHIFTLPRIARSAADSQRLALKQRKWIWEFLPERARTAGEIDRKSTRLNSSHQIISYAVFCLKKKKNTKLRKRYRHWRQGRQ